MKKEFYSFILLNYRVYMLLNRISVEIVCRFASQSFPETKMRENLRTPLSVTNLIENLFLVVGFLCGRSL
jgi:hypothetical protein